MMHIGLISDTHGYYDPQIDEYFEGCDEIWHAGDFGTYEIVERLRKIAPVIGVYGNIDGHDIRQEFPLHQRFERGGLRFWMTHIGGNPGRYALPIRQEMEENPPDVFICGHSHILKVARDPDNKKMIYINPGAAGKQGFQVYRTLIRFDIDEEEHKLRNMEVINLGRLGAGKQ